MKKIKIEFHDKKVNIQAKEVVGNIFVVKYQVAFEELELDTFWKRLKWLLTGEVKNCLKKI